MVPKSLLSFTYHITEVSAYRDEMHHDMRQAFARFGIDLSMMQQLGGNAQQRLEAVMRASYEVERASYAKRANPNEVLSVPMEVAAPNLFLAIVPFLAREIEVGQPGDDQAMGSLDKLTFLHAVYLLFYSAQFRAATPKAPAPASCAVVKASDLQRAWSEVRSALLLPVAQRPSAAMSVDSVQILMHTVGDEFACSDWIICW
jgi:hypothetical protein